MSDETKMQSRAGKFLLMSVEVSRVLDRSDGVSLQAKVQATILIIPERGAWRRVLQQSEIRFNMTINFF